MSAVDPLDVPYWIVEHPPAVAIVPWSGEFVPPDAVPVDIPPDIPIAGPVIQYVGNAEHAVWDDVWGFVKGAARQAIPDILAVADQAAQWAVKTAETYTGELLSSFAGFVNDAVNYTHDLGASIVGDISYIWGDLQGAIDYLDGAVYTILADVVGIDARIADEIIPDIYHVAIDTEQAIAGAVDGVETWAIDNIYTPLDALVRQVETAIPVWAEGAYVDAKAYADDLVHSETAKIAAAVAAAVAAAAVATTWIDDCGEPMCQTLGPKTDLGKLFKALQLAGDAALLAELAGMNEADLVALVRTLAARFGGLVTDFERFFDSGNETIGQLVSSAVGSAL